MGINYSVELTHGEKEWKIVKTVFDKEYAICNENGKSDIYTFCQ